MDTEVTAIYCITDDWLKARHHQESAAVFEPDRAARFEVALVPVA